MLKVSRILVANSAKAWVSPQGQIVPVGAGYEHANIARKIMEELEGVNWDPDYERDAFTELLDLGWIRVGAILNQTYIMMAKVTPQLLRLIQTIIMKHPEFQRSRVNLEQYAVENGQNLYYFGVTDEFLNLKSPQEAWRAKAASVKAAGMLTLWHGGNLEEMYGETLARRAHGGALQHD